MSAITIPFAAQEKADGMAVEIILESQRPRRGETLTRLSQRERR
jgi:hypothetical protein